MALVAGNYEPDCSAVDPNNCAVVLVNGTDRSRVNALLVNKLVIGKSSYAKDHMTCMANGKCTGPAGVSMDVSGLAVML